MPVIDSIQKKIENCEDIRKKKLIIDFNDLKSSPAKLISIKNESVIKCTTRFMSGKLLKFAKLSLKSFIYLLVELLHFTEENPIVAAIYEKYKIDEIRFYQILTDTDSTSIQFIVISDSSSTYRECDVRDIFFEIFSRTEIRERFDKSNEFWKKIDVHVPEVENMNDPCYVTLAVNPKEYFEYFESENCNKKHKGIKKGAKGMEYENYAEQIKPIIDFKTYQKPKADIKSVGRISVKKGEITTYLIKKNKFSELNDKLTLKKLMNIKKVKVGKLKNIFGKKKRYF